MCVFLWSHASCINPLIARTVSDPEAKPLSLDPPGLGGCLRSAVSLRDPHEWRANVSTKEAAVVAAGRCDDCGGAFALSALTESLPAMFLLRHAEDVMDLAE